MRGLLAYSKNGVIEEKLTLRIKADNSGDIYLPTAGFSQEGTQNCSYDWMVSVDGNEPVNYKGTGSSTGKIRVGYGLTPLSTHTVIVEPSVENYGWLRAFGYKGTDIASSLINIVSDKSYKGFALSDKYSGNYFKAYQYYGCTNLINTDEELLPDTLEVIGDYYRYYEYDGCISLVSNAEEKILKTVRAIGNYYRAYQYQNCTSINKINMRAINWASVGNNYRYNQFNGMSSDKKPVSIYIEGGIEEGGDWGLEDSKVKGVYVYKELVSDYVTKLSSITSSKIQKNAEWDGNEYEFIEYIALADSTGKIRIPVGGYSTSFTKDCAYDWMVSIDGGEPEEISGTGGATYVSVGSGLTEGSEHRVIIKPKTIGWGWGRAFGFHTTGAQAYIKEIIHDSYKCFASSRTSTGDYYKYGIFTGCTNLINSYEKLPTSVETIGDYYMKECYAGCTGLKNAFWEVLHSGITIGDDYRHHQYVGCTAMEVHQGVAGYTGDTYPTNYKYEYLSGAGDDLVVYMTRYEPLASGLSNSMGLADNKVDKVMSSVNDYVRYMENSYWSNITDSKFGIYYFDYTPDDAVDISKYTLIKSGLVFPEVPGGSGERDDNSGNAAWRGGLRGIFVKSDGKICISAEWSLWSGIARGGWAEYTLSGDTLTYSSKGSSTGGLYYDGNMVAMYLDYKENAYYISFWEGSSGYQRLYYQGRGGWKTPNGAYTLPDPSHTSASRDGWWTFFNGVRVCVTERWGSTKSTETNYTTDNYTNVEFSDDGLTAYISKEFGAIKQYTLSSPWDLDTKVDTGKTLSISNCNRFIAKDKKHLYTVTGDYYGATLNIYEYQE